MIAPLCDIGPSEQKNVISEFDDLFNHLEKHASYHRDNDTSIGQRKSTINTKFLREKISMVEVITVIFNKIHLLKNDSKWTSAVQQLERLRMTVRKHNELADYEGVIHQQLGSLYHRLQDFSRAVDMFSNALALSRLADNVVDEGTLYGQIGMYLYCIHSYKDALQMHEQHVILSNRSSDVISLIVSNSNVGLVLLNLNRFDEAKIAIKTSIAHCQAIDDYYGAANGTARLAQCMHMTGDYSSAKSLYEKCRKGCERYGDERALNLVDINIALCLHNMRQYKEAKRAFWKLIESRPSLQQDPETLGFIHTYSARTSFMTKSYETAMADSMTAIKLFDIIPVGKRTKLVRDTEKKAYDWLILSCIQLKKYMEALLYVETCVQKIFKRIVTRPLKITIEDNELVMDTLKTAICRLNTPILAFHMIQVDTDHTYLIRWLVFPTSDRNNIRVVCHCNLFSTSVDGGNDVRQWVSKCRRSLGLGGWDWTDGSSAEIPFENELNEFNPGQELLIISRDILSLLPFPAMMDKTGLFVIEKFKLRYIAALLKAWKMTERKTSTKQQSMDIINSQNTCSIAESRLWQRAYLAGKSIFSSLPRLHQIDHEISQLSTLLDKSGLKYELMDGQGPTLQ
eukprot:gene36072-46888_t